MIDRYDTEIVRLDRLIHTRLRDDAGYKAIQRLVGVGPVSLECSSLRSATFLVSTLQKGLSSWAGLTPRHRESDTTVIRGPITKQGSALVRWGAIEAVARYRGGAPIGDTFGRVAERKGVKVARVAAARKLLTLVYYGLRDGEIRCLQAAA